MIVCSFLLWLLVWVCVSGDGQASWHSQGSNLSVHLVWSQDWLKASLKMDHQILSGAPFPFLHILAGSWWIGGRAVLISDVPMWLGPSLP